MAEASGWLGHFQPRLNQVSWGYVATWRCDFASSASMVAHVVTVLQHSYYNIRFGASGELRQKMNVPRYGLCWGLNKSYLKDLGCMRKRFREVGVDNKLSLTRLIHAFNLLLGISLSHPESLAINLYRCLHKLPLELSSFVLIFTSFKSSAITILQHSYDMAQHTWWN